MATISMTPDELVLTLIFLAIVLALVAIAKMLDSRKTRKPRDVYSEIDERIDLLESRCQNEPEAEAMLDRLMICELRRAQSRSRRNGGAL